MTATSSPYIQDILSQPQQLRGLQMTDIIAAAAPVWQSIGDYRRIVLTGMGASLAALRPLWLSLVAQGRPAAATVDIRAGVETTVSTKLTLTHWPGP